MYPKNNFSAYKLIEIGQIGQVDGLTYMVFQDQEKLIYQKILEKKIKKIKILDADKYVNDK